jgi:hypothetical protein
MGLKRTHLNSLAKMFIKVTLINPLKTVTYFDTVTIEMFDTVEIIV